MTTIDRARLRAREICPRVVFPEWEEPRIAAARAALVDGGYCHPVPPGDITGAQVHALCQNRGMKEALAHRMLAKPLVQAAAMVAAGDADVMVAGATASTRRVIEAAGLAIGLRAGVTLASSVFLMVFPDGREFVFADCALNVAPDAAGLAMIAQSSARTARALFGEAEVALLSFSTGTSGAGDSVNTVREAAALTGFAGPVQADTALNAAIAAQKGAGSGGANTLIFPSLDAGNIAYKLCQELGGAQAIGPLLQGFAKPVCDLSRGAGADDIVAATLLTIAMSAENVT